MFGIRRVDDPEVPSARGTAVMIDDEFLVASGTSCAGSDRMIDVPQLLRRRSAR